MVKTYTSTGAGQRMAQRESDPARRFGRLFRAAEDLDLGRDDIGLLIKLRPDRYEALRLFHLYLPLPA